LYPRTICEANMLADAIYLRECAHQCVALARNCPHLPTSQALEALGVELMEKAAELEELSDNKAEWEA
jgi:hypothetical protein